MKEKSSSKEKEKMEKIYVEFFCLIAFLIICSDFHFGIFVGGFV